MPRIRTPLRALPLSLALLCATACGGGMPFVKHADVPEERIAVLADQVEEVVRNTRLDEPSAPDYSVEQPAGQAAEDFEPLSVIVSMDDIRREVPALAELDADTEAIVVAIRGRILRRPAVDDFQELGCLGENRQGLVQVLKGSWCVGDRAVKNRAAYIVWLENRDRRNLYEQVAEAYGLGRSGSAQVQEIFAQSIYKKAWAGTPLEMPDGTWERR